MSKNKERLFVFVFFLFCLALRLAFITQKNLWFDEIFSWHLSQGSFLDITWGTSADIHPPFYYYLLKVWILILGDSVLSLRLLSALFTSSAVFIIYPISRKVIGEAESFIVLILYSISPLNLYYSQEVRMAALNLLLNAAALYYFFKVLEFKGSFKGFIKNPITWAYIVFTSLALYTHYFSFAFLAGEIIYLIVNIKKLARRIHHLSFLYILVFAAYLFWLPIFIKHMSTGQPWRKAQGVSNLFEQLFYFSKDVSLGLYHFYGNYKMMKCINVLVAILFSVTILSTVYSYYKNRLNKKRFKSTFPDYKKLIIYVTITPILIACVIFIKEKIEFFRYLSFIVPFILICGILGIWTLNKKVKIPIIILFAVINLYGVYLYYNFDFKNNDYRQVIKTLDKNDTDGSKIFVYPHYYGWIINYYKKQEKLNIPDVSETRYGWGELQDSLNTYKPDKFWLVLDYGSQDTITYNDKLNSLTQSYNIILRDSFPTVPFQAKIYRFEKKN